MEGWNLGATFRGKGGQAGGYGGTLRVCQQARSGEQHGRIAAQADVAATANYGDALDPGLGTDWGKP